jgi:hypothetical protein
LAESAEQERVSGVVGYYDKHALELSRRYDALSFETVHETLLPYLPRVPATAIDIGAGSGRDAITLDDAFLKTPERFVRHHPKPPQIPTAVWINPPKKPKQDQA